MCNYTPGKNHALKSDSTPMKLTLFERVMTTKRDRKKRVFRSTVHSVIFLRCVLTIFRLRTKLASLICPQFLLSPGHCSHGETDVKPQSVRFVFIAQPIWLKDFSVFFFYFRVLGQQCKAYFSSTAFQQAFFSSFLWSPGPTCTYVWKKKSSNYKVHFHYLKYEWTFWLCYGLLNSI